MREREGGRERGSVRGKGGEGREKVEMEIKT